MFSFMYACMLETKRRKIEKRDENLTCLMNKSEIEWRVKRERGGGLRRIFQMRDCTTCALYIANNA